MIKQLKSNGLIVEEVGNEMSTYVVFNDKKQFVFSDEDDTLGNFLQSIMHNKYIREKKPAIHGYRMTHVGYYCPHPLDHKMILSFKFDESHAPSDIDYILTLKEHCTSMLEFMQGVQVQWQKLASI